jgi:hypothetical protein
MWNDRDERVKKRVRRALTAYRRNGSWNIFWTDLTLWCCLCLCCSNPMTVAASNHSTLKLCRCPTLLTVNFIPKLQTSPKKQLASHLSLDTVWQQPYDARIVKRNSAKGSLSLVLFVFCPKELGQQLLFKPEAVKGHSR